MQKKIEKKQGKQPGKQIDYVLCIVVLLLLSLGIIMVLSSSAPQSLSEWGNSYEYVKKQLFFGIVGIVLMCILSKIDYRKYQKFSKLAYIVACVVLLLVIVPGIGKSVNGARRWINLGFGQFQPSEIAKVCLIGFYAAYLTKHKDELGTFGKGFIKPFIWLIPPIAILFFVQDHLSASLVIILVVSIMMMMAGSRIRHFVTMGSIGVVGGLAGMIALAKATGIGDFRLDRLTSFLNPWADSTGSSWQIVQSLYAIGSGGLFGAGLGESKQKFLYIPEPHNDFIFSILAEELGFIGCFVVIVLFAILIWRGVLVAMRAPDMFGSLLAVGITALVAVQVIINIAVVTSSIPVTGMPLPFFSYGGTALVILLCAMGVLLNISRAGQKE